MEYRIEVREFSSRPIAGQREVLPMEELPRFFGQVFGELYGLLTEFGVPLVGAPFAIYHSVEEGRVDVEAALPLGGDPPGGTPKALHGRPIIFRELEGGPVAFTLHVGLYDRLGEAYRALYAWAEEEGYQPVGPTYEVYLSDPGREPEEDLRTEVYLPVRR